MGLSIFGNKSESPAEIAESVTKEIREEKHDEQLLRSIEANLDACHRHLEATQNARYVMFHQSNPRQQQIDFIHCLRNIEQHLLTLRLHGKRHRKNSKHIADELGRIRASDNTKWKHLSEKEKDVLQIGSHALWYIDALVSDVRRIMHSNLDGLQPNWDHRNGQQIIEPTDRQLGQQILPKIRKLQDGVAKLTKSFTQIETHQRQLTQLIGEYNRQYPENNQTDLHKQIVTALRTLHALSSKIDEYKRLIDTNKKNIELLENAPHSRINRLREEIERKSKDARKLLNASVHDKSWDTLDENTKRQVKQAIDLWKIFKS